MKLSDAPVAAVLPVTDLDRAKKFYIQTLGLKEMEVKKHEGEEVMLEAGKGTGLLLYKRPPVKVEHTQAGFMVDDLESTMTELKGKGVQFEEYDMPGLKTVNGVATIEGEKSAWLKDPDGNIIALSEMS